MITEPQPPRIDLPKVWQECVKSAALHAIALSHYAIVYVRAWAADSINARGRLAAENDRLHGECEMAAQCALRISPRTDRRPPWRSNSPRCALSSRSATPTDNFEKCVVPQDRRIFLLCFFFICNDDLCNYCFH
jgi:hypothetical protein